VPTLTVQCTNPECALRGEPRVARTVEVGDQLYLQVPVICSCGCQVLPLGRSVADEVERRPATPAENQTKPRPRNASRRQPERR
jgi:hypothetical protein